MRTYYPEIWKFRFMVFGICICSNIMTFDLKWVHMARYELILGLDGALWHTIISGPLLTQKWRIKNTKMALAEKNVSQSLVGHTFAQRSCRLGNVHCQADVAGKSRFLKSGN